jgi:hypothetical protein
MKTSIDFNNFIMRIYSVADVQRDDLIVFFFISVLTLRQNIPILRKKRKLREFTHSIICRLASVKKKIFTRSHPRYD